MKPEDLLLFLRWIKFHCTGKTTSRNNIYSTYWQVKNSNELFTDAELIEHWETKVKV